MTYLGTRSYPKGTLCSIEDCQKPVDTKNFCHTHYERFRLGRDLYSPIRPRKYENLQQVVNFNTKKTEHGLLWTGGTANGYGRFGNRLAHRVIWELENGVIPEDLELDHDPECPKNCVTVEHLTPRTKADHAKIGWERGQFEGNGWTEESRKKRTKVSNCILCSEEYVGDTKSKYCSQVCHTKASNLKRKERRLKLEPGTLCPTLEFDTFSRKKVWEEDQGICGICNKSADSNYWHLDHKIPRSKGGEHIRSNVQVSHPKCNLFKGSKLLD